MPQAKKTTTKRTSKSSAKKDPTEELMEFEQFVSRKPQAINNRGKGWLLATLFVIIIFLLAALFYTSQNKNLAVEQEFRTVILDDNQAYYAKIVKEDALYIYLDDVYYTRWDQQVIPATEEGEEDRTEEVLVLVKRGEEALHRPSGLLQINRDKVIAIEDIGKDSDVYKIIMERESLQ
ncbi:hypothetical protein C0580_00735 [Candidatus Parcubacteria bacterium]|nr:MAG: hypothetical protein C0580_00735 [Candidatus Parcubacteria bacterium]